MSNKFKVPQKVWRKWNETAQRVFNETYRDVRDHQDVFSHPKAPKHTREQWRTVAWNSAWIAADSANK
jgi:hypothetical protein